MSTQTTNIGLTKVVSSETIGDFSNAMNGSGGNLDIIDTKMGAVGNTSLQAQITALNSQIGKIHYIDTSLASDKNTAVKRLHDKWSTFAAYMATKRSSGIFCFAGFITFPAYGSGVELGTYYVYGSFNVANSQGTVFLTQYHADDVWIYKNHGSSVSAIKISGTSVDVT